MNMKEFTPDQGDSEHTVIALHSSAANGGQWRTYARALPAGVRLHTPDLLGYGEAGAWPAGAAHTLDDEAQALAPLLAQARRPVHLVGHSYGGAVALQLALRWPRRVQSLTLYEPVRFLLLRRYAPAEWCEVLALGATIDGHLRSGGNAAAAECFVDYWGGRGSHAALPETARRHIALRMGKVAGDFSALFDDPVPPASMAGLRMPLRLLAGTRSPASAQRICERLAEIGANATLRYLPGAGHLAPLNEPERVLQWLPFAGEPAWPLAA